MHKLVGVWIYAALWLLGTSGAAIADGTPSKVRMISLQNDGAYVISDVWVKWKDEDNKTQSRKFTADITSGYAFCADLAQIKSSKNDPIPEGAEVWIEAQIALGPKQSCKKDKSHTYSKTKGGDWYLRMKGETLTNNRCRNTGSINVGPDYHSGNDDDCFPDF